MSQLEPAIRRLLDRAYFKYSRSPRYDYWRLLEQTQYLSETHLRAIQFRRLAELFSFVYKNNAFYREQFQAANVGPDALKAPEDIRRLPILSKKVVRENVTRMISDGYNTARLLKFKTGGSTGKALEIYITETCSELRNAVARRHDRWSGWEVGEPVGAIWGNPTYPRSLKAKAYGWIHAPYIYLDTMAVSDQSVRAFVRQWEKTRPTLIFGHSHSIYILAQSLRRMGVSELRPKGIISSSMMLLPHERQVIEAVFETKVTDRYGCEEVGLIGCECEHHEGMHLNIEHLFIEFIKENGEHAAPGEPGHIVVTDLLNRAMPLIRYKVEDVGVPSTRKCPCGRGLPLMDHVAGRVADFLIKKDGTRVAGVSLIENSLTRFKGLDQMQIIQSAIDTFQLNIVPGKSYGNEVGDRLKEYFKTTFGDSVRVDVSLEKRILPEKSGKYRFSICMVKNVSPNG